MDSIRDGVTDGSFDPRHYEQICFACGDRNPHGLHMRFERDPDGPAGAVVCYYSPRDADQGFPGTLHGGIISTLLDESMAWALWAKSRALGVTAKMETRFRQPVLAGTDLSIHAVMTGERGRRMEVEAAVAGPDGTVLVEASALFLRLPPDEEARIAAALGWDRIPR
ncbi:MAG: PaaI family thioesterase [Chloroflexi bacterium]|nr:PaaI family thioesterase [Chloroflexota bacterium]MQC17152.1 PaaI family thioesterase [Chloroflexota bacterium]